MIQEYRNRYNQSNPTKINSDKYVCNVQEAYEDFPNKELISKKAFIQIIKTFNLILLNEIITTGVGYKLPYGIGIFCIKKHQYKRLNNVDWKTSKKLNQVVRYKEGAANGFTPRFTWLKTRSYGGKFTFTDIWRLRLKNDAQTLLHHEAIQNNNIVKYY